MNFFRRKKQRHARNEDLILSDLFQLLHKCGDSILNGTTKLTLTSPVLILLNGFFQKITDGVNEPCFQVTKQGVFEHSERLIFIFDFVQKVSSLKLVSGPVSTPCPLISVSYFKSLQHLEIRKIPIDHVKNLKGLRRELKSLICNRSTSSIKNVIYQFGEGTSEKYILPVLKRLDLSCNTINTLNDDSLKLVPALEELNISYNSLIDASSLQLPSLCILNLGFNSINCVPSFSSSLSFTLSILILRNNNLSTLKGLEAFPNLTHLDVSVNCLSNLQSLNQLAVLERLVNICVKGNPVCYIDDYRKLIIKRLSPVSRNSKVVFDGKPLDVVELSLLGEDVEPVALSTYIPEEPNDLSYGSIRRVTGSVSSLLQNEAIAPELLRKDKTKKKRKLREAKIADSPSEKYDYPVIVRHSSTPKPLSVSADRAITPVFSSRRNSGDNSVVFYCTSESTNDDKNNVPVLEYDSFPGESSLSQTLARPSTADDLPSPMRKDIMESSDSASSQFSVVQDQTKQHKNLEKQKSHMSLGEVERHINRDSFSSHSENDDNESICNSIGSQVSGLDIVYLVENIKQNSDDAFGDLEKEFLFLYICPPYLLEKSDNGKLRTKLDINYLKSITTHLENQFSVVLKFNLLRDDWKYRHYVFEQKESMDMFLSIISEIFQKNSQSQEKEILYSECLQCYHVFEKKETAVLCENCGSNLIIDKATTASHSTTTNENNSYSLSQVDETDNGDNLLFQHETMSSSCPDFDSKLIDKNFHEKVMRRSVTEKLSSNSSVHVKPENVLRESMHRKESFVQTIPPRKQSNTSNFESLLNKLKHSTLSSTSSLASFNESVSSKDSKKYAEADHSQMSRNNTVSIQKTLVDYGDYTKCHPDLKLYFSMNIYSTDEDFLCQLCCLCSLHNKIHTKDCLLHVTNNTAYLFSIKATKYRTINASSIQDSLEKIAFCPLKTLQSICTGYYGQYFTMEFYEANCYFKFVTGDIEKTKKFYVLLKEKLSSVALINESVWSEADTAQIIHNIRADVFGIKENILQKGERYYRALLNLKKPMLLQTRKMRLRAFHQCFVAKEFIDWLVTMKEVEKREEGVNLCQQLMNKGVISHFSKQRPFADDDAWYRFDPQIFVNIDKTPSSDNDITENDVDVDDVSVTIRTYLTCHIRVNEIDTTFHFRSVIVSNSHVYITEECHQWPLSTIHPPPSTLRKQFSIKDMVKISNITSIDLYDDAPCYCTIYLIDETSPEDSNERTWMLHTSNSVELNSLLEIIKQQWECLFAIPVRTLTHSSVDPFLEVT